MTFNDLVDQDISGVEPCMMIWRAGLGQQIISDKPLILQLRRADGLVITEIIIDPQIVGGKLSGIGIR